MDARSFLPAVIVLAREDFPCDFEDFKRGLLEQHFRKVESFLRTCGIEPFSHCCFWDHQSKPDGLPIYTYVVVPLAERDRVEGLTLAEAARSYPTLRLEWTASGVVEVE